MAEDPYGLDDDIDAFVAECEAAEPDAAAVVREALAYARGAPAPHGALPATADQARTGPGAAGEPEVLPRALTRAWGVELDADR